MRSLTDDLRGREDGQVAQLLRVRPDLAHPVPADTAMLAQRAASPASVSAALRGLDQLHLQVLLLCALGEDPIHVGAVGALVAAALDGQLTSREARARTRAAVDRLHAAALLWGSGRSLHVVGAARDLLVPPSRGPQLAGVDPVVAGYVGDPAGFDRLLTTMPSGARAALDRLLARPLVGTVADPRRTPDADRGPVDWLLAHHLVVPFGADRVVVPAEVVQLTEPGTGRVAPGSRVPSLIPPRPQRSVPDPARAESGAVAAVVDALHAVDALGHAWTAQPPARLRGGGIAARDLTRTAREVGLPEVTLSLLIEVAAGAGLLAPDSRELSTVLPTPAFDAWRAREPAVRHAQLLVAWRDLPRAVAEPGQRPLADGLAAPHLAPLRRAVLAALADDDGAGDWTDAELLAALHWRAPRLDWGARRQDVVVILGQLRDLGVLVGGWLTPAGRALGEDAGAVGEGHEPAPLDAAGGPGLPFGVAHVARSLAASIPGEVDEVILQGDLTAVVPGLPSPPLADLLRVMARPESRGVASVYRISAESIRGALDHGWTPSTLLAELGRWGEVPQPVAYLVADTARSHAALRVGAATSYVRSDDPAQLAALLADPRAAALGLFAVSDTVAASERAPEHLLEQMRTLGLHPTPDPGRGLERPPVLRARSRERAEPSAPPMTPALAAAVVRALRAGDRRAAGSAPVGLADRHSGAPRDPGAAPPGVGGSPQSPESGAGLAASTSRPETSGAPDDVVAALRRAVRDERPVLLDYASPDGVASLVRVQPLRMAGGYLTASTLDDQAIRTYSLARIGQVRPEG